MTRQMHVSRKERLLWALFFLVGFIILLYFSFNSDNLVSRYGAALTIVIPLSVSLLIAYCGKDLAWRMKKFPPPKREESEKPEQ